jgi:hypothetical protein
MILDALTYSILGVVLILAFAVLTLARSKIKS